jgi:hypothetical protein
MSVPHDPNLPTLPLLLDPQTMTRALARTLHRHAQLTNLRIARVSYKPGDRVAVHYQLHIDGHPHDAVARTIAGRDLTTTPHTPHHQHLTHPHHPRPPHQHPHHLAPLRPQPPRTRAPAARARQTSRARDRQRR